MIRPVSVKDAPALSRICESALGHKQSETHIAEKIGILCADSNYFLRVYEDEQTLQVLGFIQAEQYNLVYGGDGWNVMALAVSQEARRRGIGRKLLESLEEAALKEGSSFIRLNCNVYRTEAHCFYEHMGYCFDKTQKRYIKNFVQE